MKNRVFALALLLLAFFSLVSCAAVPQETEEEGYALYYLSDLASSGGGDAIGESNTRYLPDEGATTEDCARALAERLLAAPSDGALRSPVPEGTTLQSLTISGRRARLDFSGQYARLSGVELSLADYCFTLTLTQLPDVNAVSITANGRELPYRRTQVLLAADTLLSSRDSGPRPITVSLYFLDEKTGALRSEQQTLALYEGQTRVSAVLEALCEGPEEASLAPLLPEDFAALSARIEEGVCYVNLPSEALPQGETRALALESLERSLLSISGVGEVQLLLDGESLRGE